MIRYSVNTDATFTPYAPSNNALDAWKADITSIGTNESDRATASKAYAIGEHFYKDGKFCTAKTAIAQGATLSLNTNYEEGTVADEFTNKIAKTDFPISVGNVSSGTLGSGITADISKTGYVPIAAVLKEGSGAYWTACEYLTLINGNTLTIFANNFSSSNASNVSIKVTVTYAKL